MLHLRFVSTFKWQNQGICALHDPDKLDSEYSFPMAVRSRTTSRGHRPQPIRMPHRYPPIFLSFIGFSRPAFCRSWVFPGASAWVLSRRERVLSRRNGGGAGRVPPFPQGRANLPKCRSHGVCEAIQ
jgi:hypothetical protein